MPTPTEYELIDNNAPDLAYVLVFEGYNLAFTDHDDQEGIAAAWAAATEWSNILTGLMPVGVIQHEARPFDAAVQMSSMTFSFLDDDDDTVHRILLRPASDDAVTTTLAVSLDNQDTLLFPESHTFMPESGTLHVGTEEVEYDELIDEPISVNLTQRGVRSIFGTLSDTQHFGRQHLIDSAAQFFPSVSTEPLKWTGRMVALYLCAKVRGAWTAGADAELIWAGSIRQLGGNASGPQGPTEGLIKIECDSILKRLEKQLLRRQYRGYLEEGVYLDDPQQGHFRVTVVRTAAGGGPSIYRPAAVNILSGSAVYTHAEIATAINAQLATWFDGTSTYFDDDMTLELVLAPGDGGDFYEFRFQDAQAGDFIYSIAVELNPEVLALLLGFTNYVPHNRSSTYQIAYLSENPGLDETPPSSGAGSNYRTLTAESAPARAGIRRPRVEGVPPTMVLTNTVGDFEIQTTIPDSGGSAAWDPEETEAFFRVGGKHIIAVKKTAPDTYEIHGTLGREFEPLGIVPLDGSRLLEGAEFGTIDGANTDGIIVEQVWFETGFAGDLFSRLLLSTGTEDYNHSDFDDHPQQMGLGLPWTMVHASSIFGLLGADPYVLFVPKPTDFLPLLESAMQVRNLHAFFHRGQIRITGFGESAAATLRLTTDEMGRLVRMGDAASSAAQPLPFDATLDYLVNQLTLRYNIPFGSFGNRKPSQVTVYNSASQTDLDITAPAEIDAIGFYEGVDIIGTSGLLDAWNEDVAAVALAYFGTELWAVPCTYDYSLLLEMYPGRQLLLTNETLFHPRTGTRGVTDLPVWCVQTAFDHDSGLGECLLLFNPLSVP